jgi:hypothetical protein
MESLTRSDIEAIIRIADARHELIDRLKAALLEHDVVEVYRLAREVCGLPAEERTH